MLCVRCLSITSETHNKTNTGLAERFQTGRLHSKTTVKGAIRLYERVCVCSYIVHLIAVTLTHVLSAINTCLVYVN